MFEIPKYSIKRFWFGEIKSNGIDPDPTEEDLKATMIKIGIEALCIEMQKNTLICHVERVISSLEA